MPLSIEERMQQIEERVTKLQEVDLSTLVLSSADTGFIVDLINVKIAEAVGESDLANNDLETPVDSNTLSHENFFVRGTQTLSKGVFLRAYLKSDDTLVSAGVAWDSDLHYLYPTWDWPRIHN